METISQPPPQTCWQCQAHHQACTIKRLSRSQDLSTLYPYGDPMALTYDNVSSPGALRSTRRAGQGRAGHWEQGGRHEGQGAGEDPFLLLLLLLLEGITSSPCGL